MPFFFLPKRKTKGLDQKGTAEEYPFFSCFASAWALSFVYVGFPKLFLFDKEALEVVNLLFWVTFIVLWRGDMFMLES